VLRSEVVGDGQRVIQIVDENHRPLTLESSFDVHATRSCLHLRHHDRLDAGGELDIGGHKYGGHQWIMLGLRYKAGGNEQRVGVAIGDDHDLGHACARIDSILPELATWSFASATKRLTQLTTV
jgi:hypothetical protein